jgi:hypothetical protein
MAIETAPREQLKLSDFRKGTVNDPYTAERLLDETF